jgi:hypothetical protein
MCRENWKQKLKRTNLSILITLTIKCFTWMDHAMDPAESLSNLRCLCGSLNVERHKVLNWMPSCYKGIVPSRNVENMIITPVLKRLSICYKNNCVSYCIILNWLWRNVLFQFLKSLSKKNLYIYVLSNFNFIANIFKELINLHFVPLFGLIFDYSFNSRKCSPRHFILKCLYHVRKVKGHVFVC